MAGGRFKLVMEPMAIGLDSLNSNSETHMTAICDARVIYGRGWISRLFICCAVLNSATSLLSAYTLIFSAMALAPIIVKSRVLYMMSE